MQKVVITTSLNFSPEEQTEIRLTPLLADGFRVISATTTIALHGTADDDSTAHTFFFGTAL